MLEDRSPASSLIDAAVFGLLPGAPAAWPAAGPATPPSVAAPAARAEDALTRRADADGTDAADCRTAEPAPGAVAIDRAAVDLDEPAGVAPPAPTWPAVGVSVAAAAAGDDGPAAGFTRSAPAGEGAGGATTTWAEGGAAVLFPAAASMSQPPNSPPPPPPPPPPPGGSGSGSGLETEWFQIGLSTMDFLDTAARVVEDPGRTPYPAGPEYVD